GTGATRVNEGPSHRAIITPEPKLGAASPAKTPRTKCQDRARRMTPATVEECHLPPRAVGTRLAFSSSAISRDDFPLTDNPRMRLRASSFTESRRRAISRSPSADDLAWPPVHGSADRG